MSKLVGKSGWLLNYSLGIRTTSEQRHTLAVIRKQQLTQDIHVERKLVCTMDAVDYVAQYNIPGDFVECGVFMGAQAIAAATVLQNLQSSRKLYLYDTFEGHGDVHEKDGELVKKKWKKEWMKATFEQCQQNIFSHTSYPQNNFVFVKGFVQDTIPQTLPEAISILRLDMDMYEPTKHALEHLYPKLSVRGILIIDDYSKWPGARRATDEYIAENNLCLFLQQTNQTQVTAVKV